MIDQHKALASRVMEGWKDELVRSNGRSTRTNMRDYCYSTGRKTCGRWMALDLMHPEEQEPFDEFNYERFQQGNDIERMVIHRLSMAGQLSVPPFAVVGGQERVEIRDRDGTLLIVGRLDLEIEFEFNDAKPLRVPTDIKAGMSFQNCRTQEDCDRGVWSRGAVDQVLSYMLVKNRELGWIAVHRHMKMPRIIPIFMTAENLDRAEAFLQEARAAVDARFDKGPLPDYTTDETACKRCPHLGKSCVPPRVSLGDGLRVDTDPELIQDAERVLALKASADEYKRLDKSVKATINARYDMPTDKAVVLVGPNVVAKLSRVHVKASTPKPRQASSHVRVGLAEVKKDDGDDT